MTNNFGKNQKVIIEKIIEQGINLKHCSDRKLHASIFCNPFDDYLTELVSSVKDATWIYVDWKFNKYGFIYPVKCTVMSNNKPLKSFNIF